MSKKKEQLGQGLRALLGNIDKSDSGADLKKELVGELSKKTEEIAIDDIEINPFQPRKEFDQEELLALVQSIKSLGLIQAITVRSISESRYQIISGERRWRASKLAGLKTIPAYIRIADDQGMLEMALVENIQRSDLNPLEIAISYQRLIEECDLQHDELAKRVGKERSTVSNYVRLLKLPPDIQSALKSKKLSMGHARALIGLEDPSQQLFVYKKLVKDGLSVRQTEALVRDMKNPSQTIKKAPATVEHPEVKKIKDRLSYVLGSKVEINRTARGKGKIVIHFNSDDQFNNIVDQIDD
ncbi:MAG: ParB/RepB/Spo0J family partition protein [Saprospiraceae bacterium]|jgi:ParB family chromosome partitioning protein